MTGQLPLGGITMAEFAANLSAMTCPTGHANAVPVEDLGGERVASLCPDCDRQLPAEWRTPAERREAVERDHRERHHGHPRIVRYECRLCAEESGWVV